MQTKVIKISARNISVAEIENTGMANTGKNERPFKHTRAHYVLFFLFVMSAFLLLMDWVASRRYLDFRGLYSSWDVRVESISSLLSTPAKMLQNHSPADYERERTRLLENLPQWHIEYMEWHANMTKILRSPDVNFSSPDCPKIYLLSVIDNRTAAGLADRLRSLPFLLYDAWHSRRVLWIEWTRPCPLEEFFLPPPGGIDWRVSPGYIEWAEQTERGMIEYTIGGKRWRDMLLGEHHSDYSMIRFYSNHDAFQRGMPYMYFTLLNDTTLEGKNPVTVMSKIFATMLKPAPVIQRLWDEQKSKLGLDKGRPYLGVHLRARYALGAQLTTPEGIKDPEYGIVVNDATQQKLTDAAIGALECLVTSGVVTAPDMEQKGDGTSGGDSDTDNARPLVFFASDTNEAVRLVVSHNTTIEDRFGDMMDLVGTVTPDERLHFKHDESVGPRRDPSEYYPSVTDLLLLSEATCLSVGLGAYARLS